MLGGQVEYPAWPCRAGGEEEVVATVGHELDLVLFLSAAGERTVLEGVAGRVVGAPGEGVLPVLDDGAGGVYRLGVH